jgi:hypothetical protein
LPFRLTGLALIGLSLIAITLARGVGLISLIARRLIAGAIAFS